MRFGLFQRLLQHLPSQCLVCHDWPTPGLCAACVGQFAQPVPRCQTCALAVPSSGGQCGACITAAAPLDACLSAVSYAYPWADLIARFKFNEHTGLASALAVLLKKTPGVAPALAAATWVLPMPLSAQRLQLRGFNQALLLARQLAPQKTDAHLLLRIKDTPPQRTLSRRERLRGVTDAFAVAPLRASTLQGARVVLVDDVMTSGASLFAAARTLRAAGAVHITGLVVARTE